MDIKDTTNQTHLVGRGEKWPGMWAVLLPSNTESSSHEGQGSSQPSLQMLFCLHRQHPPLCRQRQNPSADGVSSTYGQQCSQGGSSWWEELLKSLDKYLCPEDGGSPGRELGARITGNPIRFSSRKSLSLALLPKLLILKVTWGLIKNIDLLAPTPIR